MRRIILFLLFFSVPMVSWASDHCTDPDKYTIDKRCYVTNEQKKEMPYKAVVGIYGSDYICCTGTIVNQDDELYIYTARHCVEKSDGSIEPVIWIKFQNNRDSGIRFVVAGDDSDNGDWAVYRLSLNYVTQNLFDKVKHQANENMEDTIDYVYAWNNADDFVGDFTAVGYGGLKIMSDKDIEIFRERYLNYLKRQEVTITEENRLDYGLFKDGGIATTVESVQQFIDDYGLDALFDDSSRLKFSNCSDELDCQIWAGDSGGPLFDAKNRLTAVRTRGFSIVGGGFHANSTGYISTIRIYKSVKELKEMEPKVILIKDN